MRAKRICFMPCSEMKRGTAPCFILLLIITLALCKTQTVPAIDYSSPDIVKMVQAALSEAGFYTGELDGNAGPMTQDSIAEYRKAAGLPDGTGIDRELILRITSSNHGLSQTSVQPFQDGLEEYRTGQYLFAAGEDLDTYAPNMIGRKVYTVGVIRAFTGDGIQISLNDGSLTGDFRIDGGGAGYDGILSKDDKVAILGTVDSYDDDKEMGRSVHFSHCLVFASGSDADTYNNSRSDSGLADCFTVTDQTADSSGDESYEDDYKALCQHYPYEDIIENPDAYKGKYTVVSGKVDEIMSGFFDVQTIYIIDADGNKWECSYLYKDGESRLAEGDLVDLYGKCNGVSTAKAFLGRQVTVPYVKIEYIG